jgi:Membrane protein putatively involved in post-translational modification of the autoinducing quorum-sensing peptide
MQRLSRLFADYVIHKGMVDEAEREIYEYGFMYSLEVGCFVLFCLLVSVSLRMYINGILFFIIFSPLRSYAGGLHLKRYGSCFFLSCLTFSAVLLVVKYAQAPKFFLSIILVALETLVYLMYPVENANRKVDKSEDRYFKAKLKKFLVFDLVTGLFFIVVDKEDYLLQIVAIFMVVVITMLIGKYRNN